MSGLLVCICGVAFSSYLLPSLEMLSFLFFPLLSPFLTIPSPFPLHQPSPRTTTPPNLPPTVHNPGTIPYVEWNYLDIADITVVFEETFAKFIDAPTFYALKSLEETYNLPKSAFAIMMHSIPNVPDEMVEWIAVQMKEMTQWGFISSVVEAGEWWHSFSKVFEPFVWEIGRARG